MLRIQEISPMPTATNTGCLDHARTFPSPVTQNFWASGLRSHGRLLPPALSSSLAVAHIPASPDCSLLSSSVSSPTSPVSTPAPISAAPRNRHLPPHKPGWRLVEEDDPKAWAAWSSINSQKSVKEPFKNWTWLAFRYITRIYLHRQSTK
jgi:hypothetical protein